MRENNFFKILKLYSNYKGMLIVVMINTFVLTATEFVYPYVTQWTVKTVIYEPLELALKHVLIIGIILTGLWILSSITSRIKTLALVMCDKISTDLENTLFAHYESLSFSYYDDNSVGAMMSTLDGDIGRVYEILYSLPTDVMSIIINTIGCCIIFSDINLKLFSIFIPLIPLRFIWEFWVMKHLREHFKLGRELSRKKFAFVGDKLDGIRTTIAFSNQEKEICTFKDHTIKILEVSRKKWFWDWMRDLGSDTFSTIYYLFIHVAGIYFAIKGQIPISDMIIFYMYSYMIINPFNSLSSLNKIIRQGLVSYEKIEEILNTSSEIKDIGKGNKPNLEGEIEFKDVSFQYSTSESDVIRNINLKIPQGQFVAIVGPSGSGKSTLAGLLARFYEVSNGKISIDGISIQDIDLKYLRKQVGVLQQNTYLFNGTVIDNILYGVENATEDQILESCKQANADMFIKNLPQGYQSIIGEKGVKLSGGQRQRIAIARLFLTNPKILVFDEATSSLDNMSEHLIQESLRNISKGRTTIVIAHRLSTIRNADRIIYLSNDGIEEDGTHESLMKLNGKYAQMYNQNHEESL